MNLRITKDFDKKLTEIYSSKVTVNINDIEPAVNSTNFWNSMELIAVNHKAMLNYHIAR